MTERDYLVSLGLAKPGRGRFSADAKKALDEARSNGVQFDKTTTQIAREEREAKPKTVVAVAAKPVMAARPAKDSYDAKSVRAWGEKAGVLTKGARGKLPTSVITSYLAEKGASAVIPVARVAKSQPAAKMRDETTAWTYAKRRPSDPSYITEPLVAFTTCAECNRGISHCKGHGSDSLPVAPKYLGSGPVMLVRPSV